MVEGPVGKIAGKTSTSQFDFILESGSEVKKWDYVSILHNEVGLVLAQVREIEKKGDDATAHCEIIGYRTERGFLRKPRTPLEPQSGVYIAKDHFLKEVLGLREDGLYLGLLEGKTNLKAFLEPKNMITKHLAVLAKSGAGKSYSVAVLLEELASLGVPIVIFDPHGEYSSIKYPNKHPDDEKYFKEYGITAHGFKEITREFAVNTEVNAEAEPLKLATPSSPAALLDSVPFKLTNTQKGLLYNAVDALKAKKPKFNIKDLIEELEFNENPAKWNLITGLQSLYNTNLFSFTPTMPQDLVRAKQLTILNLKGAPLELQQMVVQTIASNLFESRKLDMIPPFFMVVEEAHSFVPERGYGEALSSKVLRTVASVDYKEPILIKEKGLIKVSSIGNFIDSYFDKSSSIEIDGNLEIIKLRESCYTPAMDTDFKIKFRPVKKLIRHKIEEPLYELILEGNRKVKLTGAHSVFAFQGGRVCEAEVSKLKEGDYIVIPRTLPEAEEHTDKISIEFNQTGRNFRLDREITLTPDFVRLLGYFIAEGHSTKSCIGFTLGSNEIEYVKDVTSSLERLFKIKPYIKQRGSRIDIIANKTSLAELFKNLCGDGARNKKLPYFALSMHLDLKAELIRGLFNGDGYMRSRNADKAGFVGEVSYKTVSEDLSCNLYYLLLSMSIPSNIYSIAPKRGQCKSYQLCIQNRDSIERLIKILHDNKNLKKFLKVFKNKTNNTCSNIDLIPTEAFIKLYKNLNPIASDPTILERMTVRRKRANRNHLLNFLDYATKFSRNTIDEEQVRYLKSLCTSDIGFARIKKIASVKSSSEYVYDISVGDNESFVGGTGGILLHNSEGRKFGLGLCVISQRPARVEKNVLSQCSSQIALQVTNPNDLKAISHSFEGITLETEDEIRNLPIGKALVIGAADYPVFVDVRVRKSQHGGRAQTFEFTRPLKEGQRTEWKGTPKEQRSDSEMVYAFPPRVFPKDLVMLEPEDIRRTSIVMRPCLSVRTETKHLVFDLNALGVYSFSDKLAFQRVPDFVRNLSPAQSRVMFAASRKPNATLSELFAVTGMGFNEVASVANTLIKSGVMTSSDGKHASLRPEYVGLFDLKGFSVTPQYIDIPADKMNATLSEAHVDSFLAQLGIRALSKQPCYIPFYRVELASGQVKIVDALSYSLEFQ